jgi:hypothetical protein
MGLKITTQIGTDKGITSEAYVRISDYQINKYGSANFRIEIFQQQSDSVSLATIPVPMYEKLAHNRAIGDVLTVVLFDSDGKPDLTPVLNTTVFTYAYAQLKAKLITAFGEENVVDC